jgi:hypothetical protein
MADLVTKDAGQLGLVVQVGQDAAREIDIAARDSERVDGLAIYHREGPWQAGAVRLPCEAQADVRDVPLHFLIVVDAHLPSDLGVGLLPDGELLGFAHQVELALAGDGVGGASHRHEQAARSGAW